MRLRCPSESAKGSASDAPPSHTPPSRCLLPLTPESSRDRCCPRCPTPSEYGGTRRLASRNVELSADWSPWRHTLPLPTTGMRGGMRSDLNYIHASKNISRSVSTLCNLSLRIQYFLSFALHSLDVWMDEHFIVKYSCFNVIVRYGENNRLCAVVNILSKKSTSFFCLPLFPYI